MNKILLVAILALVVVPNQSFASDYEEGSDEYSQEGSQFAEKQLNSSKEEFSDESKQGSQFDEKQLNSSKEKEEAEEEEKPVIRAR